MKIWFMLAVMTVALSAAVRAGTLTGTVKAAPPSGGPDAGAASGDGAYDSRRYKFVEKVDYARLRDFVVYIDQELPVKESGIVATVTTTQKDANFDPHVLPVAVGTSVKWPNEDDIFHNVFSMSDAKPFDLGYYKKEKSPVIVFDQVGQIDVFCAIHTKMHCIVLVVPNRFFAKADEKGRFSIPNLPAGTYKVKAWHERFPRGKTLEITVAAEGETKVDFTLGLGDLPKY